MEVVATGFSNYDEYRRLILKRDSLKKEAFNYQEEYYRRFGDYIRELFEVRIKCISLKKKISYCQMRVNRNEKIEKASLDVFVENFMKDYYVALDNLIKHVDDLRKAPRLSLQEVEEIKRLYRYIAKKIHPDMYSELFKRADVRELWNRAMLAYKCNNLKELREIKVLVDSLHANNEIVIDDIEDKIADVKDEIDTILHSDSYQYKFLLEDDKKIEDKINEFNRKIEEFSSYKKELEATFNTFHIEGNAYA